MSLVGFVRFYLRAGRPWLAWTVCGLRTLSLILNFVFTPNLNYREITALRHVPLFGESISIADGVPNPWMLLGQLSLLLWVIFVADAAITVWRRGDRRQALVVGGSFVFFTMIGTCQAVLSVWGIVHMPITSSLFYMSIVAAMAYEMSREVLRSAQLSDDLRESEERMTMASEAAGFGVWMWNIARNQIWGSERWLGLFGFAPNATVTFENIIQRIHPDDREGVERTVRRAVADRSDYASEYRVVLPDNTQRWVAARGRVHPDTYGKSVRMMGATIDITARKQAEAETLRQRAELAHVARVSTMGELAASVTHELNQPLGAILANAEAADLFLNQNPPALDELRAILTDIRKDDERASEVISRMRALLRKHELQRLPLEINSVVEDVLQVVSGDAALRKMAISADLAPGLPKILGDHVHLQQVLINLILNGMDAMASQPRERRRLSIRTRAVAKGAVEVAVIDSGHGIEADKLPRVFEPFFSTKPNGMGMGLSISRTIIEAHRGRISAENNASGGATFRVTFPGAVEGTMS